MEHTSHDLVRQALGAVGGLLSIVAIVWFMLRRAHYRFSFWRGLRLIGIGAALLAPSGIAAYFLIPPQSESERTILLAVIFAPIAALLICGLTLRHFRVHKWPDKDETPSA